MLGNHGAVQVDENSVDRAAIFQAFNDLGNNCFIGIARHRRGWNGTGPQDRYDLPTSLAGEIECPCYTKVNVARIVEYRRSARAEYIRPWIKAAISAGDAAKVFVSCKSQRQPRVLARAHSHFLICPSGGYVYLSAIHLYCFMIGTNFDPCQSLNGD